MSPHKIVSTVVFCSAAAIGGAGASKAQQLVVPIHQEAAPHSDTPAPIDITANQEDVDKNNHHVIYTGAVDVIQGEDELNTPRLDVFYKPKTDHSSPSSPNSPFGASSLDRMEASGPVYYRTGNDSSATGDHGTYLSATNTVTLYGNVVIRQGKNVSSGDKAVWSVAAVLRTCMREKKSA